MFRALVLTYLGVHKTYLEFLFKKFQLPAFYPGVASVDLTCGPRITAFAYSIAGASETAGRDCTAWWESAVRDGLAASGWLFLAVQMRCLPGAVAASAQCSEQ